MPPALASLLFTIGILGLIWLDRDKESRPSAFLWIPVTWMFIGASRMPTEWLSGKTSMDSPDQLLDGSPIDRQFVTCLLVAALIVLATRGERVKELLKRNWPIVLFFVYCAFSTLWSDYPLVAFKRWTKSLGNVAMVALVLTETNPFEAVKQLFARTGFLLVAISVLFVKYYPNLGRGYDRWLGTAYYNGVTTDKNLLGCVLLVFGLAALSRVCRLLWEKVNWRQRGPLVAQGVILTMVLWLFNRVNSATSLACFILGGTLIVLLTRMKKGRPATVHVIVGGMVLSAVLGLFALNGSTYIIRALGRDSTLTGRTALWADVLRINKQPLLGTGFESFWLGDRAKYLWEKYWWHPNEAHNGYLEVYLNLGLVGAGIMLFLLAWGYRNIVRSYRTDGELGALRIAVLMSALLYNITEAAFKVMNPMWIAFLLAIAVVPELTKQRAEQTARPALVPAFALRRQPAAPKPLTKPLTKPLAKPLAKPQSTMVRTKPTPASWRR